MRPLSCLKSTIVLIGMVLPVATGVAAPAGLRIKEAKYGKSEALTHRAPLPYAGVYSASIDVYHMSLPFSASAVNFGGTFNGAVRVAFQQPSALRSQTDLILVPVQVRRHGEHVPNLTRDSFTVLQDGVAQKLSVFEEVRTSTERLQKVTVAPGEFTNELRGNPRTARYTIIAIDCINTTARDMNRLREGLKKFFAATLSNEEPIRVIAVLPNSILTIQDFTSDARVLNAAVEKAPVSSGQAKQDSIFLNERLGELLVAGTMSLDRAEGIKHMEQAGIQFQERTRRITSLEALQMVALSLAGLPGRKSLVWASSGYSFNSLMEEPVAIPDMANPTRDKIGSRSKPPGVDQTILHFSDVIEATALDEYTTHLLNTANIAVYPVDLRGTVNTVYEAITPDHKYSPARTERTHLADKEEETATTFVRLATATGGTPCYAREDVSGCFFDALRDARDYYMIGFYADRSKTKPGWHKLKVRVAEKGVDTRARGGFLYTELTPGQLTEPDLSLEVASRMVNPGLPFRGRWLATTANGDKRRVPFELTIPAAGLVSAAQPGINLEIAAIAYQQDGKVAAQAAQHVERTIPADAIAATQSYGITYKNSLDLPPGRYLVRVAVRDNATARMGSLSVSLQVE